MILVQLTLFARSLQRQVDVNVLLPQHFWEDGKTPDPEKEYPTLYLLHGHGDNQNMWQRFTNIERYAGRKNMIVIMPSADRSWYTDTAYGDAYFTFITDELPDLCRNLFHGVSRTRENTFVAGLSMGGYGALKIGLTYPERYAGVAAFSAVTDIVGFVERMKANAGYWNAIFGGVEGLENSPHDLFYLAKKAKDEAKPLPRMYLWCGTEDSLLSHTERMRDCLLSLGYPLRHSLTQGNHSWPYWDEQSEKAISYFTEQ